MSREWTQLSRWSLAAMLADLAAEEHGVHPPVSVIGIDAEDAPSEATDAQVGAWLRAFVIDGPTPLHAVVTCPGPGGDLLFVAQQPPESVRNLLQAWGIGRDKAERKSYARLHGTALEDLIKSLAR